MRRPSARAVTGWVIGAVVGLAAGVTADHQAQSWQEARQDADMAARTADFERPPETIPGPVDVVRALLEQDGLVVVDPLLAERIPEEDLQRAEAILADSPVPARIAYVTNAFGSDDGYNDGGLGPQWWSRVGEEGHYAVLFDNGSTDPGAVGLEPHYVDANTKGQPGPALVRLAEDMATWEAQALPTEPDPEIGDEEWGGVAGGLTMATFFGVFVVVPLFLGLRWLVVSRRRRDA